tara:strand:- start:3327 stop:4112 length:786 start_codon:yes stop_codon:yes gene_type:complete
MELRSLTAGYGDRPVLRRLDLAVPRSRFTALLGPNGCGKSTLLRCLAGLHRVQGGDVLLDGTPTRQLQSRALARHISILAQSAQAPEGLTVTELVRQGRYPHRTLLGSWTAADTAAVDEALSLTHLDHLSDRPLDNLSGGQRQRAWIAMTLAQQGSVLLPDEPTSYLDLAHQIEVLDLVRDLIDSRQVTVVAVLHDLNQAARYADHMVLLKDGIVAGLGSPEDVLTPERVADVFGVGVRVIADPETGTPMCIPRRRQAAAT